MTTVKAGTLRAPRSPADYLDPKRDNEWTHRWFLRVALGAQAQDYRGLFEKEQHERATAIAALSQALVHDLARAHERIAEQERALEVYRASTWEAKLQLRWARVKLTVRRWFAREVPMEARAGDRLSVVHEVEPFDARD